MLQKITKINQNIVNTLSTKGGINFSTYFNKTKDQLWSLNAAQPVGNIIFKIRL